MHYFGASNDHANHWVMGEVPTIWWAASEAFAFGKFMSYPSSAGTFATHIGSWDGGNKGCYWRQNPSTDDKMILGVRSSSGSSQSISTSNVTVDSNVRSYISQLYGNLDVEHYYDGALDKKDTSSITNAMSQKVQADSEGDFLQSLRGAGYDHGAAGLGGHWCAWTGTHTQQNVTEFKQGVNMPRVTNLRLWVRGVNDPAKDLENGHVFTKAGTITQVAHAADGYFRDAGGNYYFLLAQLFMGTLVGHAHLFGSNLASYGWQINQELLKYKCFVDWSTHEMNQILDRFRTRPAYGYSAG